MRWDDVKDALYPDTADAEDFSYERVERLLRAVRGEPVSGFSGTVGIEQFSDRVQPHSAGLADRLWYGGASLRSAQWAGEHGMNFLTSSVVKAEESEDFAEIQLSHIQRFRSHHPDGATARVSQGLVVIPTDTAIERPGGEVRAVRRVPARPHRHAAGPGADDVRARPGRHLRRRSPSASTPTRASSRSTRSPSRSRSPSSTTTTCRSSPTSPPGSVRRSAGSRRASAPGVARARRAQPGSASGNRHDDDPLRSSHSSRRRLHDPGQQVVAARAAQHRPGTADEGALLGERGRRVAAGAGHRHGGDVDGEDLGERAGRGVAVEACRRGGRSWLSPQAPKRSARMVRLV